MLHQHPLKKSPLTLLMDFNGPGEIENIEEFL